jgi:hypothetical protein
MMPVMKNILTPDILATVMAARIKGDGAEQKGGLDLSKIDLAKLFPAICDAIYSLSDADAERIVRTSLKVVQRQNDGGVWSNIMEPSGNMMFGDIDLPQMLQITWHVIEGQLGSFFFTAR